MTFCGEASTWAKLSLILLIVALGIHCTGFGTNYWMIRDTVRDTSRYGIGLWKMTNCSGSYNSLCTVYEFPEHLFENMTSSLKAVKGLESSALALIALPMLMMMLYVGTMALRTRAMAIVTMTFVFLAAACAISGMIVWLVYMPPLHFAGWSMGLTVFASTLCITAGILLIPDIAEYDYKDMRKVGGEFQNLAVTSDEHPSLSEERMYEDDIKPVVEPQGRLAAPVYHYLNYDKRRKMDGF